MANASAKVRAVFIDAAQPLTLTNIKERAGDLKSSEISMALNYLMRQRYLTRETVESPLAKGRKTVFVYKYHTERLPAQ